MLIKASWVWFKAFVSVKKSWPFYLYWPLLIYDGFFGDTFLSLVIVPIDSQDNFEDGVHVMLLFSKLCLAIGAYFFVKAAFKRNYCVAGASLTHFALVFANAGWVHDFFSAIALYELYGKSP